MKTFSSMETVILLFDKYSLDDIRVYVNLLPEIEKTECLKVLLAKSIEKADLYWAQIFAEMLGRKLHGNELSKIRKNSIAVGNVSIALKVAELQQGNLSKTEITNCFDICMAKKDMYGVVRAFMCLPGSDESSQILKTILQQCDTQHIHKLIEDLCSLPEPQKSRYLTVVLEKNIEKEWHNNALLAVKGLSEPERSKWAQTILEDRVNVHKELLDGIEMALLLPEPEKSRWLSIIREKAVAQGWQIIAERAAKCLEEKLNQRELIIMLQQEVDSNSGPDSIKDVISYSSMSFSLTEVRGLDSVLMDWIEKNDFSNVLTLINHLLPSERLIWLLQILNKLKGLFSSVEKESKSYFLDRFLMDAGWAMSLLPESELCFWQSIILAIIIEEAELLRGLRVASYLPESYKKQWLRSIFEKGILLNCTPELTKMLK